MSTKFIQPGYDRQCHSDAKDALISGMRAAITNEREKNVQKCMIMHFRRLEKYLGYEEGFWEPFV